MLRVDMWCEAASSRGSLDHFHGGLEARPDEWPEARGWVVGQLKAATRELSCAIDKSVPGTCVYLLYCT